MHNFPKRLVALARSAGALDNVAFAATDRSAERAAFLAKLLAGCAANKPPLDAAAVYAAASVADTARAVRKPAEPKPDATDAHKRANAETASKPGNGAKAHAKPKPEKPSKPADTSKADAYAERVALIAKLRASAASVYAGPSNAIRRNPKRFAPSVYSALLASPNHSTTLDRVSERDESGLREAVIGSDARGTFDPAAINLDAGIFSRLASVGFIAASGDRYILTDAGAAHAKRVMRAA